MEFWPDWQVPPSGVIGYFLHLLRMFLCMTIYICQFGTERISLDLKDTNPPMHLRSDKSPTVVRELLSEEEKLVAISYFVNGGG